MAPRACISSPSGARLDARPEPGRTARHSLGGQPQIRLSDGAARQRPERRHHQPAGAAAAEHDSRSGIHLRRAAARCAARARSARSGAGQRTERIFYHSAGAELHLHGPIVLVSAGARSPTTRPRTSCCACRTITPRWQPARSTKGFPSWCRGGQDARLEGISIQRHAAGPLSRLGDQQVRARRHRDGVDAAARPGTPVAEPACRTARQTCRWNRAAC